MSEEDDIIAQRVAHDKRFAQLQEAIAVERDMRENATIRALSAAIRADADLAMSELTSVSPLQSIEVAAIMVRVGTYTSLKRYLEMILLRGKHAEESIRVENEMQQQEHAWNE